MNAITPIGGLFPDPPRRKHDEDDLQRAVIDALRWLLPEDADVKHVPNGGQRHSKAAARLVGLGVRAGHPDLDVVHKGRLTCIELKAPGGVTSPVQRQRHQKLERCGVTVHVCRTLDEVLAVLREAGVPLRGAR